MVDRAIRAELGVPGLADELVGVSCLADGADGILARAVLDCGGLLEVIVPADEYRDGLPETAHATYDELIAKATRVRRLEFVRSDEQAHMAASVEMLRDADQLLAVWDGQPARGYGGTADVVAYARDRNLPVTVI